MILKFDVISKVWAKMKDSFIAPLIKKLGRHKLIGKFWSTNVVIYENHNQKFYDCKIWSFPQKSWVRKVFNLDNQIYNTFCSYGSWWHQHFNIYLKFHELWIK
jgi:hypothetical protein